MIHQIASVQTKTEPLPKLNKDLMKVRHIQAQLKDRIPGGLPTQIEVWSPITSGPYIVPVTRWIE